MTRILASLLAALLFVSPVYAATGTITTKDAGGVTRTFDVQTYNAGANFAPNQVICDPTTENQCASVSNGGALKVDGSAATQPVSAASLPLPTGAATSTLQTTINTTLGTPFQAGGSIGNTSFASTQSGAWNVGGAAGSPVTMQNAVTANGNGSTLTVTNYETALVNVNCSVACSGGTTINFEGTDSTGTYFSIAALPVGGATAAVSSATTSGQFWLPVAGLTTIRARISAYSAGTITVTGTPVYGTNASIAQIANAVALGQAVMASSSPVALASNQSVADPCMFQAKSLAPFSTSSGGPVSIVALSGSTKVYVCSITAVADTAIKLSFIDGTGGSCASAQHAIWGSTTAASGMSIGATGGFSSGSGQGTVGVTAAASAFCLLQSGTSLVAGNITYVQQ
jgi:hypothetical protein